MAFLGVEEHQVHVGAVVEFLSAELAEAEHREPGGQPRAIGVLVPGLAEAIDQRLAAELERGVEAEIGEVGDLPGDRGGIPEAGEVARGDAQHLALLEFPEPGERARVIARGERGWQPGIQLPPELRFRTRSRELSGPQHALHPLGVAGQQLPEVNRTGEHRRHDAGRLGSKRGHGFPGAGAQ